MLASCSRWMWCAVVVLVLAVGACAQPLTFTNVAFNTNASWLFGAIDQVVRPLNAPITYVTQYQGDFDNAWQTAPAGSWFLWGTQPDMSISTDMATWWYTSGTADTNAHIDSRTVPLNFPTVVTLTGGTIAPGNAMCNHRTTFNRFYLMGNVNTKTTPYAQNTSSPASGNTMVNTYFAWASNDGQIWNQVMNNGSSYLMAQQRSTTSMQYPFCVVDQKERVYLVGGNDTWMATDLGVTWNQVASTSFPPSRYAMSGAIYSPTTTTDTIVLIGGQSAVTGNHLNDVWSTTNGGLTWGVLTATAPWSPRRDGVFAIHNNGVMVYLGGDCGGGYCGVYSDAYVSVNGGSMWYLLAMAPTVNINITLAASAFDAAGYLWLISGQTASNTSNYVWTSTIQKSSLSFSTSAITTWSSTFTGGTQFSSSASSINALNLGAWSQGGNKTAAPSGIVPINTFTCVNTLLPTAGPFNMTLLDSGNGWGTSDVGVAQTVSPLVFQNPWSASSTVIDPITGYWIGSSWSVAPSGSWVLWGSNPDVAISTNLGIGWSTIAGIGGAGEGTQSADYDNLAPFGATAAGFGNAECAHRNTFNRFYIIGNNGMNNNASVPFFAWAANDAQTWTQVMDNATGLAMTADPGTANCQCFVDMNDNVYFMGSTAIWMSNTFGRVFTKQTSTSYPPTRQWFASLIFSPSAGAETVVIIGGQTSAGVQLNDIWSSTNYGVSWTQTASSPGFSPRASPQVGIAANGAMIVQGGMSGSAPTYLSDIWVSVNYGTSWYQLAATTGIARSLGAGVVDPYGYFYVDSGRTATAWGVSDVWKSTLSLNNIALWGPTLIPGFSAPASFACTQGTPPVVFDFVSTAGSPGWNAIDQFVRVTNVPVDYVTTYGTDNINNWGVAPAGSWLLFGTQPDVSISTNNGATWTITSGVASSNTHLDLRDIQPNFPGTTAETAGNAGCSHRTAYNRFYLLGNVASGTSTSTSPWFNWATQDGSVWYQAMDNATSYAMALRVNASSPGSYPAQCFVDQQQRVYSVAGADTWMSSNMGVTFSRVAASSYFPSRLNFAGAIYSTSTTSDTMVIMGGEVAQDCWQTSNGGQSWTQVTSQLPWGVRGNINFGVSQNNVFVVMGGDCRNSACGPNGQQSQGSPGLTVYNDVWISVTYGTSWYQVNPATTAPLLSLAAVSFDSKGYMYLIAGQGSSYSSWTSAQYVSTQPLLNITQWAPKLTTGPTFTPPASFASPTTGAFSLGGVMNYLAFPIPVLASFPCGPLSGLPQYSASNAKGGFDFVAAAGANDGTADIGLTVIPAPIVYEVPYTNSTYGSYWSGNQWAVAPAGSWALWGSHSDVEISTNQGQSWITIAGIQNAGLANTSALTYTDPSTSLLYNAQCAHRSSFNRFYVIGNSDAIGTYTVVPFFNYASDDGQTWTQVMDNATSWLMAQQPGINSGQCVVALNDVVYYIGGSAMWQSNNLGVTFTPITVSSGSTYMGSATLGFRQNPTAVIYSPTAGKDTIVVLGGGGELNAGFANDVWSTSDYGNSWQAITTMAGWSPRQSPNVALGQNGVMLLYGGMAWTNNSAASTYGWTWYSDIWVSLNGGSVWYLLNANSTAGSRAYGNMVVDNQGYVYVAGGESIWSTWLSSTYRTQYSLYNLQQWLPSVNQSITIPRTLCPTATPIIVSSSTAANNGGGTGGGGSASSSGGFSSGGSSGLSGGAIAGIVIGSVVGVLLLLVIFYLFCWRAVSEKKATSYEEQPEHSQVSRSAPGELHNDTHAHDVEMAETA